METYNIASIYFEKMFLCVSVDDFEFKFKFDAGRHKRERFFDRSSCFPNTFFKINVNSIAGEENKMQVR